MKREFDPDRLDLPGFAEASATLVGHDPLTRYRRLMAEAAGPSVELATVDWQALGQLRAGPGATQAPWLHLTADALFPMVCQRCLAPVEVPVDVDRSFRFAPDEATAAAEDESADEDVLVVSSDFDLRGLVEDELLMALPVAPRHEVCPEPVVLSAVDDDFEAAGNARPNPFAALDSLRKPKAD